MPLCGARRKIVQHLLRLVYVAVFEHFFDCGVSLLRILTVRFVFGTGALDFAVSAFQLFQLVGSFFSRGTVLKTLLAVFFAKLFVCAVQLLVGNGRRHADNIV